MDGVAYGALQAQQRKVASEKLRALASKWTDNNKAYLKSPGWKYTMARQAIDCAKELSKTLNELGL